MNATRSRPPRVTGGRAAGRSHTDPGVDSRALCGIGRRRRDVNDRGGRGRTHGPRKEARRDSPGWTRRTEGGMPGLDELRAISPHCGPGGPRRDRRTPARHRTNPAGPGLLRLVAAEPAGQGPSGIRPARPGPLVKLLLKDGTAAMIGNAHAVGTRPLAASALELLFTDQHVLLNCIIGVGGRVLVRSSS